MSFGTILTMAGGLGPVSYTHLDVYKRQEQARTFHQAGKEEGRGTGRADQGDRAAGIHYHQRTG